jgi:hypothetical protein
MLCSSDDCFARLRRDGSDHPFVLHWNIDGSMPHAGAGSLALHQACVIEEIACSDQ